ncbi:hypothetical protein OPT61_g8240 [Boeremia exigua]|uniref:Uncharacterized protein n=1 Tax=Boeremia exigua TaxID=749465 RepID=A0ACC2HZ33_9PLEO|nr:hypothetical protein OPT61_g8240 [Boeremia exigua]
MVLLPKGPGDPMKEDLRDFEIWRDGGPINLTLTAPQFACKILRDFKSQEGYNIQFREGMQGNMLEEKVNEINMMMALIFIQGITPRNTWVPRSYIDVGVQLTGNIDDWNFGFEHVPTLAFFRPAQIKDKLSRTITGLLEAFKGNPQPFTAYFAGYISKNDIKAISGSIESGIRKSGLYGELSKDDCTLADLFNASNCRINETGRGKGLTGIYARFSESLCLAGQMHSLHSIGSSTKSRRTT